jgi:hypothetical protein
VRSRLEELRRRTAALQSRLIGSEVVFLLADGSRALIPARHLLEALLDVIARRETPGARIMLQAQHASDGSRLHELAQALRANPEGAGEINPGIEEWK